MEKVGMRRESHWINDRPKPEKWISGEGFKESGLWEDGYGYAILENEYFDRKQRNNITYTIEE